MTSIGPASERAETRAAAMSGEEIVALARRHTIFEWSAQNAVDPIPDRALERRLFLDA